MSVDVTRLTIFGADVMMLVATFGPIRPDAPIDFDRSNAASAVGLARAGGRCE